MVRYGDANLPELPDGEIASAAIEVERVLREPLVFAARFRTKSFETWFHCSKKFLANGNDCEVMVSNFGTINWVGPGVDGQLTFTNEEVVAIQRRLMAFFMNSENPKAWNGGGSIVADVIFADDWIRKLA